jgi:hypothetical protein
MAPQRDGFMWKVIHGVMVDLTSKALLAFLGYLGGLALLTSFLTWLAKHLLTAMGLPGQPAHVYVLFGMLAFSAMVLSSVLFLLFIKMFGDMRNRPRLALSLGNLVWQYRTTDDLTAFFILASLINKGEPSVALNWKVQYRVGTSTETAEIYNIMGSYALNINDTRLTFTNDNLLNLKTLETPVQKGQFVGGRIFFVVPGDRTGQIESIQHTIEIECQDYLGNTSTATFKPDPKPPKSLLSHYQEKRESIKEEPKSVTQPASVSYTQEPPSLGDGSYRRKTGKDCCCC